MKRIKQKLYDYDDIKKFFIDSKVGYPLNCLVQYGIWYRVDTVILFRLHKIHIETMKDRRLNG